MSAMLSMLYAVVAYLLFAGTFAYAVGFTGNLFVPKGIDAGASGPLLEAIAINLLLLGIFAVQHSVMARRGFKRWWTRIVPPAAERSTYVLAASLALALVLWQWRPIAEPVIWRIDGAFATTLVWAVFWLGWVVLLASSFLINHFELFGLRQAWANLTGRPLPEPKFRTPAYL